MTYSLFEFVKEKFDELIADQPEVNVETSALENLQITQPQVIWKIFRVFERILRSLGLFSYVI